MFDKSLIEDLKGFKRGSYNIFELENRYTDIKKIVNNRTKEKVSVLKMLLDYNIINKDEYNELFDRVKMDYKMSHLYIIGFVTNLE